jgi:hypothetical protein
MQTYRSRSADPMKILTRRELPAVLADLRRNTIDPLGAQRPDKSSVQEDSNWTPPNRPR